MVLLGTIFFDQLRDQAGFFLLFQMKILNFQNDHFRAFWSVPSTVKANTKHLSLSPQYLKNLE